MSTRDDAVARFAAHYDDGTEEGRDRLLSAWRVFPLIRTIPADEWTAMHAGTCGLCDAEGARLYPTGWRCDACKPGGSGDIVPGTTADEGQERS